MAYCKQLSRIDTVEIKSQIFKKLGRKKAEKYFYNFKRLLSLKLSKSEFDNFCNKTIGRENIGLHNMLIRSILANARLAVGPPSKQASTGHSRNTRMPSGLLEGLPPASPRKGRSVTSRDRRFGDRLSPLGPNSKAPAGNSLEVSKSCDPQKFRDRQIAQEVISIGSKALFEAPSVEDGEEVEQARLSPGVQSRSPIRPPLGIPMSGAGFPRKALRLSMSKVPETCCGSSELPDTRSLMKRLEGKLELEGLGLNLDCANLLNNGLDAFVKRLIKPCIDLARSRCSNGRVNPGNGTFRNDLNQCYYASMQDFQVSVEINPQLLGVDWPVQLERISFRSMEDEHYTQFQSSSL